MSSSSAAIKPASAAPVELEAAREVSGAVYSPSLPAGAASTSIPAPLQSTSPGIRVYEQSDVNCANPQYSEISLPYEAHSGSQALIKYLYVCVDGEGSAQLTLHAEALGVGAATLASFKCRSGCSGFTTVQPTAEILWSNASGNCRHRRQRADSTITVLPGKYTLALSANNTGDILCKGVSYFNYIYADLTGSVTPRTYGSGGGSGGADGGCDYNDYTGSALDPVNTFSGNFTYQFTDFSLPSRGLPLVFERSYNSRDTYPGPLGQGWTHTYNTQLWFETGRVVWLSTRGARLGFTANGDGSFTPETGIRATLAFTQDTYTLAQGDNLVYTFNQTGTLSSVSTGLGHTTALSYTDGLLTGIQGEDGRALTLTYDDHRRIQTIQDPISRTAMFTYTHNALTAYQDPSGQVWTYTYDGSRLTALAVPNGGVLSHGYDDRMRVITQTNPLSATSTLAYAPGLTTIYDANGHVTQHHYDATGALTGVTDASGHTIEYTRDANQNIIGVADAAARAVSLEWNAHACSPAVITDTLGHVTQMSYDDHNQLTGMQDALGRTTQYGYDGHRLITITDALGGTVIHTYDAHNLRVQTVERGLTTTYGYDAFGQVTAITNTLGQVMRYGYDAVGRLITTTNPAGQVTVNEYDARDNLLRVTTNYTMAGGQNYLRLYNQVTTYAYSPADLWGQSRRTWMTDTHGRVTRYEYDLAGRLVRTTRNYLSGYSQNYQDTYNLATEYGYDAVGNQVAVTDTLGNVTYTEYDALGRVARTWQNYLPGYPQNYQNTYNHVTEYGYDTLGNQVLVTDTLGNATYTEYDALDRVAQTWQNYLPGYPQNYQDTHNRVTEYGYDAVSNQVLVTDTLGSVTYTEYDALNRPVTVTTNYVDGIYDPNFPAEDLIRVTLYDAAGRVLMTRDHAARTTYHEYDVAGRLITVTTNYVDGNYDPARPDEDIKQVTIYDEATGRVMARWQMADTTIPTYYEYDVLGRLVTTTNALSGTTVTEYDVLGRRAASIDAEGNAIRYGYDVAGRLVTTTNALSGTVVTTYDALGRRSAVANALGHTSVYTYDAAGRLIAQADPLGNVSIYSYDALGRRVAQTDADGVSVYSIYDAAGRLNATCDDLGHCTQHTYDALGRRVAQTDARDVTTAYEYDALGRLTAVVENDTTTGLSDHQTNVRTTYTYDLLGNMTAIENALGHTTVYTYDLAGRRVATADALGHVTGYDYDGHGRQTAVAYPDAAGPIVVTTDYNALGLPTQIQYPDSSIQFGYNTLGHRTAVTDALGVMAYDYDALYRPVDIAAPTGGAQYRYDALGQRTHLIYPTGEVVTYTHDATGRLTQVLDWSGGTTLYTYTAAGRLSGIARPNDVVSAYSYDSAGRLAQIEHRDPAAQLLARYTYTLDGVGNRTHVTETQSVRQEITPTGNVSVQSDAPATYVGNSLSIMLHGKLTDYRFPDVTALKGDAYITGEQYLAVWLGYPGIGTGPVVYARAVSSTGALGASFLIRNNTSGNVTWQPPRVSYDPTSGRALVVWKEGYDIYGRLVNMRTTPPTLVGMQPFVVADGDSRVPVNYAAVAANTEEGGFLVVYERSGDSDDVYGQFVTSSGSLDGATFEIATNALEPDVAFFPNTPKFKFMVVWETQEDIGSPSSIQGRLVGAAELDSIFTVYASAAGQHDPAVSYNAAHQRFLVAWTENGGIQGRQLTTAGGYGGLIAISASGAVPDVGGNELNGNWLVSWSGSQVFAREISGSGSLFGDLLTFGAGETSQSVAVSQASPHSGRYLTVWHQTGDIRGRLVGPHLVAGFAASPTGGSAQLTVHFTDTTQLPGMAEQWQWSFGDGTHSAAQHPEHIYSQPGVYTVQLTALDQDTGDIDSVYLTQGITVVNPFILETRAITYTYDSLNRLTAAHYSTGESYGYQYDAVGNRAVMMDATGAYTYTYDAANRLTSIELPDSSIQEYTWDNLGNLLADGAFTYTYSAAGRMVRATNLDNTIVYTYTADGLRVQQAVGGLTTSYAWDWATGVPELLSDGDSLYLIGHDTLGWQSGADWTFVLPDALGSVRQETDATGAVSAVREWSPYGEEVGGSQAGLGYTGEWFDTGVGLQYLRARWYDGATGRFTQRDPWEGNYNRPQSLNRWAYVEGNPIRLVDPSGYTWDWLAAENVKKYRQAFLDSAQRHNRIPTMDDNGFAALIASLMVSENRMGNSVDRSDEKYNPVMQKLENIAVASGCIVSGHYLQDVCMHPMVQMGLYKYSGRSPDLTQWNNTLCWQYLNNDLPGLWDDPWYTMPSVGWGNIKIATAAGLWDIDNLEIAAPNPFGLWPMCNESGFCMDYEPTRLESYQMIGRQLLNPKINIEYFAAHLEEGQLQRVARGLQPTAFMTAVWHYKPYATKDAIWDSEWNWGAAVFAIDDIPKVLDLWGLTTNWVKSEKTEPDLWWLALMKALQRR